MVHIYTMVTYMCLGYLIKLPLDYGWTNAISIAALTDAKNLWTCMVSLEHEWIKGAPYPAHKS